jgi:4-hydroxy-tetrahydrodipicolinate synthase
MSKPKVRWRGSFAVIVTPFKRNGAIDEAGYRKVVDFVIRAGCHGVIAAGSTGEFFLMSDEERGRVFDIAVDQARGRVPVLGCPAAIRTETVVALTKRAAKAGCQGVMVLPPLYIKLTEREVKEFYRRVSGEGGLPIMLYNSPRYVNNPLYAPLVRELMAIENVVAIKDSTWDIYTCGELLRQCPGLTVFVGLEDLVLPAVAIGAHGVVSMLPQVLGRMAVRLYETAARGELDEARRLHFKMLRAYDILKVGSAYIGIKEAMNQLGLNGGYSRPPMLEYTPAQKAEVRKILKELGLR